MRDCRSSDQRLRAPNQNGKASRGEIRQDVAQYQLMPKAGIRISAVFSRRKALEAWNGTTSRLGQAFYSERLGKQISGGRLE
jgi:hypothetical protein